jgi:hypothetical protein
MARRDMSEGLSLGQVPTGHLADYGHRRHAGRVEQAPERLIYREEVLGIIGALADILVEIRDIRDLLKEDEEEEE